MAQITINEISQNYTYNIGTNSFATVAMPITACWGPAYTGVDSYDADSVESALEEVTWDRFPATQAGLEAFVSTYRGPASNYRLAKDYSYQMAMTLLTAGYDVLVCRLSPGTEAVADAFVYNDSTVCDTKFVINAKYPGSFGNNLRVSLAKVPNGNYWNLITYVVDSYQIQTAVENLIFTFDLNHSNESIPHISELDSKFLTIEAPENLTDEKTTFADTESATGDALKQSFVFILDGGKDLADEDSVDTAMESALDYAKVRYTDAIPDNATPTYITKLTNHGIKDVAVANTCKYREWLYTSAYQVFDLLQDKLNYNPQRIILPGWDDQDICELSKDAQKCRITDLSPLHIKLMETAYHSRCGAALLDIPKSCARAYVYNDSDTEPGYAQMLSRYTPDNAVLSDINVPLYSTHSALFAPWGAYQYVGTGKQYPASPSFQALMIHRAMILNQPLQYEWALPANRRHNLKLGKSDYKIPKKILDVWQKLEGVGVNVITDIPELGTSLWGNSTLFEVPAATYQALANLSTRYLVNAVEDVAYKCGISITFQYNNEQAYNMFYAGVTPLLETMKNVGAIEDYYVKMSADIDGLDRVNANTVIGKIYLVINGVINDIIIDLIALPPGTDLNQYRS